MIFDMGRSGVRLNLPQFNGHFKTYTDEYTMRQEGVSDAREKAEI
jgi:hypothetical protein